MTIDITKIRPGDKVTLVPLEVVDVTRFTVDVIFKDERHWIAADRIAAHHPAPREFQVGDRVRFTTGTHLGTVRGVANGEVWVVWDSGALEWAMPDYLFTLVEAGQ